MRAFLAIVALALASAVSLSAPVTASDTEVDAGDKVVCKHRMKTGTRFKKKDCRTVAQWEAMAEENRRGLNEIVNRPQVKVCGPSGCD